MTYRLAAAFHLWWPKVYRSKEEEERWGQKDPVLRFASWMQSQGLVYEEQNKAFLEQSRQERIEWVWKRVEKVPGVLKFGWHYYDVYGHNHLGISKEQWLN